MMEPRNELFIALDAVGTGREPCLRFLCVAH